MSGEPVVIDETIATIHSANGNEAVKLSDLSISLDGESRSFIDVIHEKLVLNEARKYQITVPDEEVDKFLADIQKSNRWTRDTLLTEFENLGFSYQEGRELIKERRMVNQILQFKVDIEVSDEEVTQLYQTNPPQEEATITIEFAFVPFTHYTAQQIDMFITQQTIPQDIIFEESENYKISQITDEYKVIADKEVNTVMITTREDDGYVLARMAKKTDAHPLPLSECYTMISNKLRHQKFEEHLKKYYEELVKNAHITILNPAFSL